MSTIGPWSWPGYELREPLGRGGMGTVYRAWHVRLQREVALKVLPALDAASAVARQRFLDEARVLARLSHPHVVPVHDVLEADGACAFAMELVAGGSLAQVLAAVQGTVLATRLAGAAAVLAGDDGAALVATHRSWVRFLARVGQQLAAGLAAVHGAGLVHRDVKPDNILLRRDGTALLADFGLVRDLEATVGRTVTGQFVGTLAYAAPEQLRAQGSVDARADVYALGATLYHALTLVPPFAGDHPAQVLARIATGSLPPAHRCERAVPRDLSLVIAKAMDPEPARRYPDAASLAADLGNVLALRPVGARPPRIGVQLRRACARHPVVCAGLVATVLALLVSLALILPALAAQEQRARIVLDPLLAVGLLADVPELAAGGAARAADLERWLAQAQEVLARADLVTDAADTPADPGAQAADRDEARAARARAALDGPRPPANAELVAHWVLAVQARQEAAHRAPSELLAALRAAHAHLSRRRSEMAAAAAAAAAATTRWAEAARDAADTARFPHYRGLQLTPQDGLVPLGADPHSGLLEFAHLATGPAAERDPTTGALRLNQDSGVVLVLLPGGVAQLGCRAPGPGETDGVEFRDSYSSMPMDTVRLDPFLIGKTELTQAQWQRITGRNPSWIAAGTQVDAIRVTGQHPVESVLHEEVEAALDRVDLVLPTLAQWEYAARGGTTTRYWTGPDPRSMAQAENVRDRSLVARLDPSAPEVARAGQFADWDDHWPIHAPVASFKPNPFGLFDMLGNVQEYGRELAVLGRKRPVPRDGDGELNRVSPGSWQPMTRGGAWNLGLFEARVAFSIGRPPGVRNAGVGVRASRPLRSGG